MYGGQDQYVVACDKQLLEKVDDVWDEEFESFKGMYIEYEFVMSPKSDIERIRSTTLHIGPSVSSGKLVRVCDGTVEKLDIVTSVDKFPSDAKEDGKDGQPVWFVLNEACVFNLVFEVWMIFSEKNVMNATIKSRA